MPGSSPGMTGKESQRIFRFWGFILRDASLRDAPQDEVSNPHGEEREAHRFRMLLRMRSRTLVVRSAKRVSNHAARYAAKQRSNWSTLEWT